MVAPEVSSNFQCAMRRESGAQTLEDDELREVGALELCDTEDVGLSEDEELPHPAMHCAHAGVGGHEAVPPPVQFTNPRAHAGVPLEQTTSVVSHVGAFWKSQ